MWCIPPGQQEGIKEQEGLCCLVVCSPSQGAYLFKREEASDFSAASQGESLWPLSCTQGREPGKTYEEREAFIKPRAGEYCLSYCFV